MPRSYDVFISYKSVDHVWVNWLADALRAEGIRVWLDSDQLRPGDLFVTALEQGLENSRSVALIVSPESVRSGWVVEEYSRAVRLAQDSEQPLQLIPVLLRDAELPGFLGNRTWVDFRDNDRDERQLARLIWGITGDKEDAQETPSRTPSRRPWFLPLLLVGLIAVVVAIFALIPRKEPPSDVNETLLIVPSTVEGQAGGPDLLSYVFAQDVAVDLAQNEELRILPVPQIPMAQESAFREARKEGANRVIASVLTRSGDRLTARVTVTDVESDRVIWGTVEQGSGDDVGILASRVVLALRNEFGLVAPARYGYVTEITGADQIARTPARAIAIGALRRLEVELALSAAEELVSKFPDSAETWTILAHARLIAWDASGSPEMKESVRAAHSEIKRIDPKSPYVSVHDSYILHKKGRHDESLKTLARILRRRDLSPAARAWALRLRALPLISLGRHSEAVAELARSIDLDPAHASTYDNLSVALRELGRYDEALERARQALAIEPSYWRHSEAVGFALDLLDRSSEAVPYFERACDLSGGQESCGLYALSLVAVGQLEKAGAVVRDLEKMEDSPWGSFHLACYHARTGNRQRALDRLQRAIDLGFADDVISTDPDLRSLRGEPRFNSLVDAVRQNGRASLTR